jgi:hypothetical protein
MDSKIQLSAFEEELLNNKEWILTKNGIIKKAQQLLAMVQDNMVDYATSNHERFPAEVLTIAPKISKGENYLGLPWLMLDYPRFFNKENLPAGQASIFAIRTMFWWGNFFSITLHLSGKYQKRFSYSIAAHFEELAKKDFYSSIHEDQWQHHFHEDNYKAVSNFSVGEFSEHVRENPFLKLSKKFSLTIWNEVPQILSEEFVRITNWLD